MSPPVSALPAQTSNGTAESGKPVIRATVAADFPAALALLGQFYREEGFDPDPTSLSAKLSAFLADPERNTMLLAFIGTTPIGFSTVSVSLSLEFGRFAEIDDLYVLPDYRGGGHGKQLLEAAWQWATETARCACVSIVVTPEAEAAHGLVGFYGKYGFKDSRRHILYRDTEQPVAPTQSGALR
ncbi:MAG: GNAT family N-acetyltransferase [Pseudomonadota bacterium]